MSCYRPLITTRSASLRFDPAPPAEIDLDGETIGAHLPVEDTRWLYAEPIDIGLRTAVDDDVHTLGGDAVGARPPQPSTRAEQDGPACDANKFGHCKALHFVFGKDAVE